MIIQVAIVGYAFRIAHSYVCIYIYIYKKDFTLNSAAFVCDCICDQSKILENLLRVFVCDVISFLLLFDAQHLRRKRQERHLTGVNYLPLLSIREKERMNE